MVKTPGPERPGKSQGLVRGVKSGSLWNPEALNHRSGVGLETLGSCAIPKHPIKFQQIAGTPEDNVAQSPPAYNGIQQPMGLVIRDGPFPSGTSQVWRR